MTAFRFWSQGENIENKKQQYLSCNMCPSQSKMGSKYPPVPYQIGLCLWETWCFTELLFYRSVVPWSWKAPGCFNRRSCLFGFTKRTIKWQSFVDLANCPSPMCSRTTWRSSRGNWKVQKEYQKNVQEKRTFGCVLWT